MTLKRITDEEIEAAVGIRLPENAHQFDLAFEVSLAALERLADAQLEADQAIVDNLVETERGKIPAIERAAMERVIKKVYAEFSYYWQTSEDSAEMDNKWEALKSELLEEK